MSVKTGIPIGLSVVVAGLIALVAFGIAQISPGGGMPFVMIASGLWIAFSISYKRKWHQKHG